MTAYPINRGAENEIEFQGLRGKYVWQLLIGLSAVLFGGILLFLVLPEPSLAAILLLVACGGVAGWVFRQNRDHGRFGRGRRTIQRRLPRYVVLSRPHSLLSNPDVPPSSPR